MVEAAPVVHIGENSPEGVAYRLLQNIAAAEGLHIGSNPTSALKLRDRKWVLDTYAECLYAVRGHRSFTKMSKQPTPKRASMQLTDRITGVKSCPYREGAKRATNYARYKVGMSVEAALEAGCSRNYLSWDRRHGHIRIEPAE